MSSLLTRLVRAGFSEPPPSRKDSELYARLALLGDLRRKIERVEAPAARLPTGPHEARRAAPLDLDQLDGASREADGVVVIRTRFSPEERVGRVAPADALVAPPDVAAPLCGVQTPAPSELLHGLRILDIETTGLAGGTGTLAFLVGVARFEADGTLLVEQLVLRAPSEEPKVLAHLATLLDGASLLCTFNGRSFDAPLLKTRCVLARRSVLPLAQAPHLDLLPIARRLFRARVGDCRLITLEERVLRRRRANDLPGHLAPAAYRAFLATGDAAHLTEIVAHNRDDLIGTAALLAAVLRTLEDPMTFAEDATELLAVGEHRLRLLDEAGAVQVIRRALDLARDPETLRRALVQLAHAERRSGRLGEARAAWERYRREFPHENLAYVELAKLFEHRERNPALALAVAAAAPHTENPEIQRRLSRLKRRADALPPMLHGLL
jgi:hypothetical protein